MRWFRRQQYEKPLKPPPFLEIRSAKWFILLVVGFAIFTDIFLYGIVVPVFPFALNSRAGVAHDDVQRWVSIMLAVYAVGLLVTSPLWGYMADHTSSRGMPFLLGLIALVLATVLLMLGESIPIIIAGRLLQGMSAALVWTVGLAIVSDTVGPDHVGEAMGWAMVGTGLAIFAGPMLGGIVFAKAGYYAVFGMAFAAVGIDIVLRLFMIEAKVAAKYKTSAEATESDSTEESPEKPVSPLPDQVPSNNDAADNGRAQTPSPAEQSPPPAPKKKVPSLITLLKSPRILSALWGCLVQAALLSSFDSVLPLYVARIFHWDSLGAGLIFLSLCVPTFAEPLIGKLSDRYGVRVMAVCGFVGALPLFVLLRFVTYDSLQQKVLLCALLFLLGATVCFVMPPLMAEITRTVSEKETADPDVFGGKSAFAQAYALLNMAYAAGTIVGPLWAGFVNQEAGWATMGWTLGLLSAVTAIPTFIWAGGPVRPKTKPVHGETRDVENSA